MEIGLSTQLKQQQILSPQMLQSLALLHMPVVELKEYINNEIANNPALEIPQSEQEFEDLPDTGDYDKEASDRHLQMLENTAPSGESLSEHLLKQLGVADVSPSVVEIGKMLIGNLDENGFHIVPIQELFEHTKFKESEIKKAVNLVQSFDPYGICTKDFREALIVQAKCFSMADSDLKIFAELVNNHLEKMNNGKTKEVAQALHISTEDLDTFFSILKSFTPFPGRSYSDKPDSYIIPEFSIHNKNGNLVLEMNSGNLPRLEISEDFANLATSVKGSGAKEASAYISASIQKAKSLISQVDMRYKTLYNAASTLMDLQKDFFFNGPKYLKTLTLKDVAKKINVHETTISRLSQNKFVETDWGLFQLKYFFTQGVRTNESDGHTVSRTAVKEIIAEIVAQNGRLSDQKISDMLAEKGIQCARRTVGKYRNELSIDSSFNRK